MKTIIRNARVLTMDAADTILDRADVLVDGQTIAAVEIGRASCRERVLVAV